MTPVVGCNIMVLPAWRPCAGLTYPEHERDRGRGREREGQGKSKTQSAPLHPWLRTLPKRREPPGAFAVKHKGSGFSSCVKLVIFALPWLLVCRCWNSPVSFYHRSAFGFSSSPGVRQGPRSSAEFGSFLGHAEFWSLGFGAWFSDLDGPYYCWQDDGLGWCQLWLAACGTTKFGFNHFPARARRN